MTTRRGAVSRVILVLGVGLLPWTVVVTTGGVVLVFSVGMVTLEPLHLTDVFSYLVLHTAGLPRYLQAWPVAGLLYLGALGSPVLELRGRGDVRVTAGSLALVGLSMLWVALGLSRAMGRIAIPAGTVFAWTGALWIHRAAAHRSASE